MNKMDLVNINSKYPKLGLVTFTSAGYIDLTQNLCNSMTSNNIDYKLNIFCLDEKSFNHDFGMSGNNLDFTLSNVDNAPENEVADYYSDEFIDMMYKKFEIISTGLSNFENVLYVDGDIVIKKDFLIPLLSKFKNKDIIFQDDRRPSKPNVVNVCAGFMLIRANNKMKKFFDIEDIPKRLFHGYKTHDQTYINKNKSKFNYSILPLDDFPNGPRFYNNFENLDPYLVHFNYISGEEKINTMKKYDEWYL